MCQVTMCTGLAVGCAVWLYVNEFLSFPRSATNCLGLCLTVIGECHEAIDCLQKAVDLDPKLLHAWVSLGQVMVLHDRGLLCFMEIATCNSYVCSSTPLSRHGGNWARERKR